MTFALNARLGLDAKDFVKGAKQAGDAVDDVADKVDDLADGAAASGAKTGGGIGSGILKGVGAAGVVAGLGAILDQGFDRMNLAARFQNEFGLVQDAADRLSADAGDTYADGWGESADEVRHALGLVNQKLVETGRIGQEETDRVATGALGIAEVFGEDVPTVIRSVSQLLLNGLAPDAESALDQVTAALQNGANGAGDFFDSIDEYSQHFSGFGLSAEDMFKIFQNGLANGQRDTDKLADAVKEMRIRTVEDSDAINDAYRSIGLSADDTRAAIAKGGDSARTAFITILKAIDTVADPIEKNRLAVQLIGTQYEDLGPTGITSLLAIQGATEDVTGANEALVSSMEDSRSELEKLKRSGLDTFGGLAEGAATAANSFIGSKEAYADLDAAMAADTENRGWLAPETVDLAAAVSAALADVTNEQGLVGESARLTAEANKLLDEATRDKLRADQLAAKEADLHAASVDKLRGEIDGLIDANAKLVGGELGVEKASIRARQAQTELNEGVADGTLIGDDYTLALIDATEAQIDAAEAAAQRRVDEMVAAGAVEGSIDKNRILGEELGKVAGTLDAGSALRQNVEGYSADLLNVTDNVFTNAQFEDTQSRAALLFYKGLLSEIPRNVSTTVQTSYVSTGLGYREKGGPVQEGRTYWVGEKGPELVTFGHDGYVHDAQQSSLMMNNLTGSTAAAQAFGVASAPAALSTGSGTAQGVTVGGTAVTVMIGDRELRDIVRTEIRNDRQMETISR